ncbi:MAG: ANTAR domain-containing protein, partial [Pseudonocardiaceae bacterium]
LIEQAKGVLAERHHIDPGHAFTLLRNHARNHSQRLTELAAAVITTPATLGQPVVFRAREKAGCHRVRVRGGRSACKIENRRSAAESLARGCAQRWSEPG